MANDKVTVSVDCNTELVQWTQRLVAELFHSKEAARELEQKLADMEQQRNKWRKELSSRICGWPPGMLFRVGDIGIEPNTRAEMGPNRRLRPYRE